MINEHYLIDTNILIYYFNNTIPKKNTEVDLIFAESFTVSIISRIEFLSWSGFLSDEMAFTKAKQFINNASVLNITNEIAEETIRIRQHHKTKIADAIIAATAIQNDLTLVTRNIKDFKHTNPNTYSPFDE